MPIQVPAQLAEIRRQKLQKFINDRYNGKRAAFSRDALIHPNQTNLMLSENDNHRRPMTDVLADRICDNLQLERGYFDTPAEANGHAIPAAQVPDDHLSVFKPCRSVAEIKVSGDWLDRYNVASVADSLVIAEVATNDLAPEFTNGTVVILAPVKKVMSSGVYAISGKGGVMLRRVRTSTRGFEVVGGDNASSTPELLESMRNVKVINRVVTALNFSPL